MKNETCTFISVMGRSKPVVVPDARDKNTMVKITGHPYEISIWVGKKPVLSINISESGRLVLTNHNGHFQSGITGQVDLNQTRPWNKK